MTKWNEWIKYEQPEQSCSREQALAVLRSSDDELLEVLQAAFMVRKHFFGRTVSLHVLRNAKSGACPEDCAFCSQSKTAQSDVDAYALQSVDTIVQGAEAAKEINARRYCVVTSSRAPSARDMETICEAARQIKQHYPDLELCTSLGFLDLEKAKQLREAGVDRFNHNLETSERFFSHICSTHTFKDRLNTAKTVKEAGLDLCCGGLIGLGETLEDRVDLALSLKELDVDSIPINFLNPREGTALAGHPMIKPSDCLRALAMFRFVHPSKEIRVAGGREACLREMQVFALYPANSMFTNGYLTTGGQNFDADKHMIESAGFTVGHLVNA